MKYICQGQCLLHFCLTSSLKLYGFMDFWTAVVTAGLFLHSHFQPPVSSSPPQSRNAPSRYRRCSSSELKSPHFSIQSSCMCVQRQQTSTSATRRLSSIWLRESPYWIVLFTPETELRPQTAVTRLGQEGSLLHSGKRHWCNKLETSFYKQK